MVKRGGGFNAEGAVGWEWFELTERDDESVAIKWRGVSAPSGEATATTLTARATSVTSERRRTTS